MKFLGFEIKKADRKKHFQPMIGMDMITTNNVVFGDNSRSSFIKKGYGGTDTVFSVVSRMALKESTVPILLYTIKDKKAFERYKALASALTESSLYETEKWKKKALEEVSEHDILKLLENPNPQMSGQEFREQMYGYLKLTGAGMANKLRLSTGKIQELNILPSHYISLITRGLGGYVDIAKYQLNYGTQVEYAANDVLHVRYPDYNWDPTGGHLFGMAPLRAGRNTTKRKRDAEESSMRTLQNGGSKGILSPDSEQAALDEPQQDRLEEKLNEKTNGMQNKGMISVANIPMRYNNFGLTAQEQEILSTERYTDEQICGMFNYPYVLFSADNSSYNNRNTAMKELITQGVYGNCMRLAGTYNKSLLPDYKDLKNAYFAPDITGLPEMQNDIKEMVTAAKDAYWLTIDEKRAMTGYDEESEHGSKIYIPSSMIEINDMGLEDPLADADAQQEDEFNK